jgi:hypothetical protein
MLQKKGNWYSFQYTVLIVTQDMQYDIFWRRKKGASRAKRTITKSTGGTRSYSYL